MFPFQFVFSLSDREVYMVELHVFPNQKTGGLYFSPISKQKNICINQKSKKHLRPWCFFTLLSPILNRCRTLSSILLTNLANLSNLFSLKQQTDHQQLILCKGTLLTCIFLLLLLHTECALKVCFMHQTPLVAIDKTSVTRASYSPIQNMLH